MVPWYPGWEAGGLWLEHKGPGAATPQLDSPLPLVDLFPSGRSVGEKIFKMGGFEKTFQDAQQICTQAGGQMASPRSAAENEALKQLVADQNKSAFLSMTDNKKEGTFTYPTGEPLVYSNWAPGEPNNRDTENCVEIYPDGTWNDKACGDRCLVICEF